MVGGVPRIYRKTGTPIIANYSYTDIAEGTGVIRFYGAKTMSGANYILTTSTMASNNIFTKVAQAGANSPAGTYNFDVTFNMPRTAKGTAYIEVPVAVYHITQSGKTCFISGAAIIKVSDGISTEIGVTDFSDTLTGGGADATYTQTFNIPIILTQTHFKKGDILRLRVPFFVTGTGANGYIGHDPAGRIGQEGGVTGGIFAAETSSKAAKNSQLVANIPFVIDI